MKVFELRRDDGGFSAFEIESVYIRPKKIAELLSCVDGVSQVGTQRITDDRDVRVSFRFSDVGYIVCEPFGDSSRYWIGPKNDSDQSQTVDISPIVNVFRRYKPPLVIKIIGDLLTLKFKSVSSA